MKKLVLAVAVVLSTTVQALTINELMTNPRTALTALGVADYYTNNCAGLTGKGKNLMIQAFYTHEFNKWNPSEVASSKEFKLGQDISSKYTCNSLRSALTDAGAGALIR
jgi:hypothetical protein